MDRESSPVKDGRFTNCDTQPTEATLQGAAILSEHYGSIRYIKHRRLLYRVFCREALCICDLERATA